MLFIKILAVAALFGSIVWFIAIPGFEPALAVIGSLSALISIFIIQGRKSGVAKQKQTVSKSSVGIQAGGDIKIGEPGDNNNAK